VSNLASPFTFNIQKEISLPDPHLTSCDHDFTAHSYLFPFHFSLFPFHFHLPLIKKLNRFSVNAWLAAIFFYFYHRVYRFTKQKRDILTVNYFL